MSSWSIFRQWLLRCPKPATFMTGSLTRCLALGKFRRFLEHLRIPFFQRRQKRLPQGAHLLRRQFLFPPTGLALGEETFHPLGTLTETMLLFLFFQGLKAGRLDGMSKLGLIHFDLQEFLQKLANGRPSLGQHILVADDVR